MIERGLFFRSVSELEFDPASKRIRIVGLGTELNRNNRTEVFQETGKSPHYIATILPVKNFGRIDEILDHFYIVDGKITDPLMFTFMTDKSSFTFGKSWFHEDSVLKFSQIAQFMQSVHEKHQINMMVDGLNFLMFGE